MAFFLILSLVGLLLSAYFIFIQYYVLLVEVILFAALLVI